MLARELAISTRGPGDLLLLALLPPHRLNKCTKWKLNASVSYWFSVLHYTQDGLRWTTTTVGWLDRLNNIDSLGERMFFDDAGRYDVVVTWCFAPARPTNHFPIQFSQDHQSQAHTVEYLLTDIRHMFWRVQVRSSLGELDKRGAIQPLHLYNILFFCYILCVCRFRCVGFVVSISACMCVCVFARINIFNNVSGICSILCANIYLDGTKVLILPVLSVYLSIS